MTSAEDETRRLTKITEKEERGVVVRNSESNAESIISGPADSDDEDLNIYKLCG